MRNDGTEPADAAHRHRRTRAVSGEVVAVIRRQCRRHARTLQRRRATGKLRAERTERDGLGRHDGGQFEPVVRHLALALFRAASADRGQQCEFRRDFARQRARRLRVRQAHPVATGCVQSVQTARITTSITSTPRACRESRLPVSMTSIIIRSSRVRCA